MSKYLTKRINKKILSPEDFVVKEIINKKFFKKFSRTRHGIEKIKGPYTLFLMKKRNITTIQAIKKIAKELNINEKEIGYAGLKDKFAVAYQYITIKNIDLEKLLLGNIELNKIGYTNNMISIGDLIGNEFDITLHNCNNIRNLENAIENIIKNGLPNYFGPQRFGTNKNNHIIGRYLIKRDFSNAISIINKNYRKKIDNIKNINKKMLKFFIHAYQSWIFNETIKRYIEKNKTPLFRDVPIFGYDTKLKNNKIDKIIKNIIVEEKINQYDFKIPELKICCLGSKRKAFIKLSNISYKIEKNNIKLNFTLPKGSYATVLLNEIIK
ncbi:MAG: tRNA pseudouridine(13) synthase TruD [Candidatus Aenigmatarchaeota archaeon]